MSLNFGLEDNQFSLNKISLPSRYYYFLNFSTRQSEPYLKLLNVGEGIFPKDRINTRFNLIRSNLIITTESATKVHASEGGAFGVNVLDMNVGVGSNLEFLNDELILYKDARFAQIVKLNFAKSATFFYSDILSRGRSYEHFDFNRMKIKNAFASEGIPEYLERFDLGGEDLKNYLKRHQSQTSVFAKVYLKVKDNQKFLLTLFKHFFSGFVFSRSKKILVGILSGNHMSDLKEKVFRVWELYRQDLGKGRFVLGKQ